jgi:NAD(P)-dependent dehydrogenase (short-subunit alcohol dehydrogenase family)
MGIVSRLKGVTFDKPLIVALIVAGLHRSARKGNLRAHAWLRTSHIALALSCIAWLSRRYAKGTRNGWTIRRLDTTQDVVVITGGCGGIGLITVEMLAAKGLRVAVLDRAPLPNTSPVSGNSRVKYFKCDITNRDEVFKVAAEIKASLGAPTILINNAGIVKKQGILESTADNINKTLAVNATSHYWTTQAFVPHMIAQNRGHIISISSGAAFMSAPNIGDYNMSKAAATSFQETLQTELHYVHKTPGVRTSTIHPLYTATALLKNDDFGKQGSQLVTSAQPPEDVARMVVRTVVDYESRFLVCPEKMNMLIGMRNWKEWMQVYLYNGLAKSVLA